jgi:hypothetical protein
VRQIVEYSWSYLNKANEELCGDSVMVRKTADTFVAVLSDGLGSGVKASILSTLTSEIAARMFESGAPLEDVLQTLVETLPECSVRKLAYATFAVLTVKNGQEAHLVEFDCPPLIFVRDHAIVKLPMEERMVKDRKIREARFTLQENDFMIMISDGYVHAGLGGIYRLGWGWDNIALAVQRFLKAGIIDTYKLTQALTNTCRKLYDDKPGDDATVVGMKVRPAITATVLTGPPANKELDEFAVSRLMASEGEKIICGGSTAQLAARVLKEELVVNWVPPSKRGQNEPAPKKGSPPTARLKGVDLVTEGILTLGLAAEILRTSKTIYDLPHDNDASTQLARSLLLADEIRLIVGSAINPNQVADIIRGEPMRMVYVRELVQVLTERGKYVEVEKI